MAPDQPPKAANGEWFTPLTAYGHRVALQSANCIVERSSTCFEPGKITAPTLSMTFDCVLSTASGPMSPQSRDRAQRPETKRPRESPTSLFSWSGGPILESVLYTLSAAAAAGLFVSGCMSLRLKNAPCLVPWLCRY